MNRRDLQGYQPNSVLIQPFIVGYMSTDVSRKYHADLSQLKFITYIPEGRLSWDLNHNMEKAVKRSTDDNTEKINLLLDFLLDQRSRLDFSPYTFISYRRTLINIMYSSINFTEPVCIRACLFNNNIYLHYIVPDKEIQRMQNCTDQEKKFRAWGYKFEQYLSSDEPILPPNVHKPVVENEEFSLIYSSQIGEHKLFYGAQIDGLLATNNIKPEPKNTHMEELLQYLRCNQYVELKTNRELQTQRQEWNFKRYKMLRCWCQCYLANLKGLLVGFRDDHGIVQRLQWFDTAEIPEYCKHEWDPQTPLNFLDYFLTFVKKSFGSFHSGDSSVPVTLDYIIQSGRNIKVVSNQSNQQQQTLLPDWYVNAKVK